MWPSAGAREPWAITRSVPPGAAARVDSTNQTCTGNLMPKVSSTVLVKRHRGECGAERRAKEGTLLINDYCERGPKWAQRSRLTDNTIAIAWGEWLGLLPWEFFLTLTFDPDRLLSRGWEYSSREVFRFLQVAAYLCRRPLAWAYALERGSNGFYHAHAVLIGAGEPNLKTLAAVWNIRNGFARIERVSTPGKCSLYTTKHQGRGEVVLADTLTPANYPALTMGSAVVTLFPVATRRRQWRRDYRQR